MPIQSLRFSPVSEQLPVNLIVLWFTNKPKKALYTKRFKVCTNKKNPFPTKQGHVIYITRTRELAIFVPKRPNLKQQMEKFFWKRQSLIILFRRKFIFLSSQLSALRTQIWKYTKFKLNPHRFSRFLNGDCENASQIIIITSSWK